MSLLMSRRSEQLFTGRKRERGTLMPCAFLKCLIAAPAAVSSCRWISYDTRIRTRTYLDNGLTVLSYFGIDDDLELHFASLHDLFESCARYVLNYVLPVHIREEQTFQIDPQIVGVEYFELSNYRGISSFQDSLGKTRQPTRLKLLRMLRRNLRDFKKSYRAIVVDESTTLEDKLTGREASIKIQPSP